MLVLYWQVIGKIIHCFFYVHPIITKLIIFSFLFIICPDISVLGFSFGENHLLVHICWGGGGYPVEWSLLCGISVRVFIVFFRPYHIPQSPWQLCCFFHFLPKFRQFFITDISNKLQNLTRMTCWQTNLPFYNHFNKLICPKIYKLWEIKKYLLTKTILTSTHTRYILDCLHLFWIGNIWTQTCCANSFDESGK